MFPARKRHSVIFRSGISMDSPACHILITGGYWEVSWNMGTPNHLFCLCLSPILDDFRVPQNQGVTSIWWTHCHHPRLRFPWHLHPRVAPYLVPNSTLSAPRHTKKAPSQHRRECCHRPMAGKSQEKRIWMGKSSKDGEVFHSHVLVPGNDRDIINRNKYGNNRAISREIIGKPYYGNK